MERDQYILKIEEALAEVNKIKQQLQKNAAEVKSEIHSGISRQLEALRNREVWLLNQVELIQNMKDEVLHIQQARLNKMLGVAQSSSAGTLSMEIDPCELKPDENPWLVFKCDAAKLRESITSYGRVEASNRPQTVFVKPGHPARSLPPHFEDYDDADHHVLYKTVEGVTKSSQDTKVTFTVPNLSTSSKDWLANTSTATTSSGISTKPRFCFPVLSSSNNDWLSRPVPADNTSPVSSNSSGSWSMAKADTDTSIQRWLKDIKQNPFDDEDEFEIISKKEFIGMGKHQRTASMSSSHSAPDLKYLSCDGWLQPETPSRTNMSSPIKLPSQLESKNTETWLCRKWKRTIKSSCEEKCSQNSPMEIENICDYLNNKSWIQTCEGESKDMKACKANEPCQGPECCISKPHCIYSINQEIYLSEDTSQWLLNGGKNVKPTTTVHNKMMEKFQDLSVEDEVHVWLRGVDFEQTRDLEAIKKNPIEMEEKVWLKPGKSDRVPDVCSSQDVNSSWNNVLTFHSQFSNSQWLAHGDDEKKDLPKDDKPSKVNWLAHGDDEKNDSAKEDNPWILKVSSKNQKPTCTYDENWILTKMDDAIDILQ